MPTCSLQEVMQSMRFYYIDACDICICACLTYANGFVTGDSQTMGDCTYWQSWGTKFCMRLFFSK